MFQQWVMKFIQLFIRVSVEASITGENADPGTTTTFHTAPDAPHPDPTLRFHLYAPNGAIFCSQTPHSSPSSTIFPVISLPGTPQSVTSSRHTDDPPDGATERYPDLVEGTHSTVVIGDVGRASSDPNLFCSSNERTYKDKHTSSRSDDGLQEGEMIPSINSVRLVTNSRDNHIETSLIDAERQITKEDKNEKAVTSPSVVPRVVLSLPGASVTSTVFICDVTNEDDEKLIPGRCLGMRRICRKHLNSVVCIHCSNRITHYNYNNLLLLYPRIKHWIRESHYRFKSGIWYACTCVYFIRIYLISLQVCKQSK